MQLVRRPLTHQAFAPFGDVIETRQTADLLINNGRCERHHNLAQLSFSENGEAGISLFYSQPVALPLTVTLVERHPLGSQAFIPMSGLPWLVVVATDKQDKPDSFMAFDATAQQGINFYPGTWHAVLMPLQQPSLFAVIDRIGGMGNNLEEHLLTEPVVVV